MSVKRVIIPHHQFPHQIFPARSLQQLFQFIDGFLAETFLQGQQPRPDLPPQVVPGRIISQDVVDPDLQRDLMAELMTIMREEGPIVQPFFMQVANAYNNRVLGIEMHPTKYIFFDQMAIEA